MPKKIQLPNVHPGEILLEEFVRGHGISQYRLANSIGVSQSTVSDLIAGRRGITADMALRLGKFFNTSAKLWMNLQEIYDLEEAHRAHRKDIDSIKPLELVQA
jgi:addiction module HigA family antidote